MINARMSKYKLFVLESFMILMAMIFLLPFYFVVVNSFKSYGEILKSAASLPQMWNLSNYANAFKRVHFLRVLFNSFFIASVSIALLVLIGSMSAWWLVRNKTKFHTILFFAFVAAMIIPFQSIMITLMRVAHNLHLINSRIGLVMIYLGYSSPLTVFLYHGYSKAIPRDIEEAARLDGCNTFQVFFLVVMPLLRSMTITVIILQTLLIWNDFLLPLLVLNERSLQTIPLAVFSFFGQYTNRWDYALAILILGMIPIVTFFLVLQKHVVQSISTGSLKG
jgi:raffinose/stachyose/melibiose transport system permease protein